MERPGKFDQEIKNKMLPLEDEPSAAVWAGIRAEIGPAMPSGTGRPWVYQIMVAASVALLMALAIMMVQKNQREASQLAEQRKEKALPTPPSPIKEKNFAEQPSKPQEFAPETPQPWYGPAYPEMNQQNLAEEDGGQAIEETKEPFEIKPDLEVITENRNPNDHDVETEYHPRKAPLLIEKEKKAFASNETSEDQQKEKTKRTLRLPKSDELTLENLKNKSKGILASLAKGAGNVLGFDSQFEEQEKENMRTTAFSANLGLFKVKKVQTVKTKNP